MAYIPVESKRYPGWYEIPGEPNALASKDGKLLRLNRMSVTEGVSDGTYKKTYVNGKYIYVHRLICLAFNGPPLDESMVANHINYDKLDNSWDNLEWATISWNTKHGWKQRRTSSTESIEAWYWL